MSRQCPWCRGRHYSGDRPCPLRPTWPDSHPDPVVRHVFRSTTPELTPHLYSSALALTLLEKQARENDRRALIRDSNLVFGISRTPPARFHAFRLAWARLLRAITRTLHIRA